jgi:hypothetical protein
VAKIAIAIASSMIAAPPETSASLFLIFCLTAFGARVGFARESRVIIARESMSRSPWGETRAPRENRVEVAVRRVWRIV